MKTLLSLTLLITLSSCASSMTRHRMQAAQRKLIQTRQLQQAGQWEAALAMAERMHSSVEKSVAEGPLRPAANGENIDLRPLYTAWNVGPYQELKTALQQHDALRVTPAFAALRQQCMNCHTVLGKTSIQMTDW